MNDYRTDYQIREWNGLADLSLLLNTLVNDGWRVENHYMGKGEEQRGWTIFTRHVTLKQPLLERRINVGEVYRILNSTIEIGSEQSRSFDTKIKQAVHLPGDDEHLI